MKKFSTLRISAAPLAVGIALLASPAYAQDSAAADDQTEAAADEPVLVVTGTRIQNVNLTAVSPVTSIDNAAIKQSGNQRTEDLLNSLPQVFAAQSSTLSNGATGTATVDLRGVGSQRTLVLINGRRLMPGDVSSSAADLNFVPASMVKRVDVLTGGASATYGADAIAGVVNFVMDTEFTGLRIDANYGMYQHNNRNLTIRPLLDARAARFPGYGYPKGSVVDGGQFDGTISFGTKFDEGRGHASAYFGYRKAEPVLQSRRDYSACTIQNSGASLGVRGDPLNPRRLNPAAPLQCGGSATSNNAVVFASYTTTTTPGTFYTSTVAALGAGTIAPFTSNRYNFAPLNYFQRPDERYTAGAFVDYEISPALHPYMEFMFMDDRTLAQIAPSGDFGNTLTVNCDNPLLSAQQASVICAAPNLINGFVGTFPTASAASFSPGGPAINFIDPFDGHTYNKGFFQLLRRNVEGGPRINDLQHTAFRAVLGMKGDLGASWSYDASYQYGRMNYSQVYSNEFSTSRLTNALDVVDDPRVAGVQAICRVALTGQDPNCVPFDVLSGAPISQAALNYLSATGLQKGIVSEQIVSAMFNGDLGSYGIKSPMAQDGVSIAIGGEYRREGLELKVDNAFATGDLTGQGAPTLPINGSYSVTEFISEIEVPIVQENGIYNLSFNGGYRYSHYSISGGNTFNTDTYKLGLDFAPVRDIRFRAAYNRAVRAPNIQELFATQFVGLDGSTDPCTGAAIVATQYGCLAQGLVVGQNVTGNPAAQYNGLLGGNPNLQPEIATTKTIGVVIQPRVIPGLSLSIDWYDIEIKNAIQGYGADAILNACGASTSLANALANPACALINRNAAGSLWLTSDGYVTDLPQNVGGMRTRGLEFNGSYTTEIGGMGTLNLNFVGTRLEKFETDNGLTELYNCAGYYGTTCGGPAPKWRHKLRMTLNTKMGISLSGQWRYFGPVDVDYKNPSSSLSGNYYNFSSTIQSQSYFDLSMTANVGRNFSWRLGVNNLLDKEPPLVTSGSGAFGASAGGSNGNTYPGTYDALGRYIYTGVTLDF
ncbi:MAG: TonB-dependent receptor [Novosphingobium sp.]|uniref:TonB-dependent receptor domain-containing protein n=1 Tax=Novosphingobium sp. TaxID=1874826 RepID=UPI0032BECDBE